MKINKKLIITLKDILGVDISQARDIFREAINKADGFEGFVNYVYKNYIIKDKKAKWFLMGYSYATKGGSILETFTKIIKENWKEV